jgi:plastocyanin
MAGTARLLALATVALTACGGGGSSASQSSPPGQAASPQTLALQLDGRADAFDGAFLGYFPNSVSVHPGDTVTFKLPHFSGEPHTVTLGTLVDAAAAKLHSLGPQSSVAAQENSPEMLNIVDVFPHTIQGPPDANQSAAQPCFLDAGVPPLSLKGGALACTKRTQPEFTGAQSFYSSGVLMEDGASYSVPFSKGIKPGTYNVICLVHRSAMTSQIQVVDPGTTVQSQADITAKGQQQLARLVDALTPIAAKAQTAAADTALAATGDPSITHALIADPNAINGVVVDFGPKTLSIPVGGTVTWRNFYFHNIAFGALDSDVGVLQKAADGSIHLSPKAGAPAGFVVPPQAGINIPPPDGAQPFTVDLGSWDGTGFRNTGIVQSLPPQDIVSLKLSFTRAGTFPYRCLIHPDMKGEVKVG